MKTVLVRYVSKTKPNGDVSLTLGRSVVQRIRHIYDDGRVCTMSGDVWNVEPLGSDKADFIAVEAT